MIEMLAIDSNDRIIQCFKDSIPTLKFISSHKELDDYDPKIPIVLRGMTKRKIVSTCEKQNRNYFYIDTGYLGNIKATFKTWHRIVPNGMQHSSPRYDLPATRFHKLKIKNKELQNTEWRQNGRAILVVTPSEKPCKFYNIDRDVWVTNTVNELKKHTDRPIIIRDKLPRNQRVEKNSIYRQFIDDDIYAVVTYNSIAASEAIGFGIPAFTSAPNIADPFCLKDLSKIETPLYEDRDKIKKWQHWVAYCQYTTSEIRTKRALSIIKDLELK